MRELVFMRRSPWMFFAMHQLGTAVIHRTFYLIRSSSLHYKSPRMCFAMCQQAAAIIRRTGLIERADRILQEIKE